MRNHVSIGNDISEDVSNTIQIGKGCHLVPVRSGDIVLATTPDEDGRFTSLRISRNGDIRVNEHLIGSDEEAVSAIKGFFEELGISLIHDS